LGPLIGGLIVRRDGRRGRFASALAFAIIYVLAGLVIQIAVLKLAFSEMVLYYPEIVPALGRWGNVGFVLIYFGAVVLALSLVGTLFVRGRASK
jgi:hypothetical protein